LVVLSVTLPSAVMKGMINQLLLVPLVNLILVVA
jgi:hypothetical protein